MLATVLCVAAAAAAMTDPPDTCLPWGVRGEAIGAAQEAPDVHLGSIRFEVSRDWVRTEQWLANGSLGYSLESFTRETSEETILYDAPRRRGDRLQVLAKRGWSRLDLELSPIGWLRVLRLQHDLGVTIEERIEGDSVIYACPMPDIPSSRFGLELCVDRTARTIVSAKVSLPSDSDYSFTYRYLDWREFPDGTAHPWRIEVDLRLPEGRRANELYIVQSLELLSASTGPTPFKLPKDAVIVDSIDNVQRDGEMNIVGPLVPVSTPSSQASQQAATQRVLRPWLIGGGIGVLALAAVAWRLRSRGIVA